jgi:AraC-like DNA-binding protein
VGTASLVERYAREYVACAEAKGLTPRVLSASIGLDLERVLRRPGGFDPTALARLSRHVKLLMEDEFCGILNKPCRIGSFNLMCELAVLSETLGDAFSRAFRLYHLLTDELEFVLGRQQGRAFIEMRTARSDGRHYDFLREWSFLLWHRFASWLIGEELPIILTEFPHEAQGDPQDYAQAFRSFCNFMRPKARIVFPERFLERRIIRSIADLVEFQSCDSIDLVSLPGVETSLCSVVRAKLRASLAKDGHLPSLEIIAASCRLSPQTLRRRLMDEGVSYRGIKDEVRRSVALRYLEDPNVPIGEVSFRAGFAEPNGLARAIRVWAGISPSEYREQALARAGAAHGHFR